MADLESQILMGHNFAPRRARADLESLECPDSLKLIDYLTL